MWPEDMNCIRGPFMYDMECKAAYKAAMRRRGQDHPILLFLEISILKASVNFYLEFISIRTI